jgi:hypothetical protein
MKGNRVGEKRKANRGKRREETENEIGEERLY